MCCDVLFLSPIWRRHYQFTNLYAYWNAFGLCVVVRCVPRVPVVIRYLNDYLYYFLCGWVLCVECACVESISVMFMFSMHFNDQNGKISPAIDIISVSDSNELRYNFGWKEGKKTENIFSVWKKECRNILLQRRLPRRIFIVNFEHSILKIWSNSHNTYVRNAVVDWNAEAHLRKWRRL